MMYSKKSLQKILKDNNVTTTAKSIAALMLIAMDNKLVTREEVLKNEIKEPRKPKEPMELKEPKEPKPRGRPRKYPKKEVDPNKVTDPKHYRLRTIRKEPTLVKLTNVVTGEITTYKSLYEASKETKHGCGYFTRHDGNVIKGIKVEVIRQPEPSEASEE